MPGEVRVFPNLEGLSLAAAESFADAAAEAISQRGRFTVALSGGSTPSRLYQLLTLPPLRQRIDWSRCHLFWGDERLVPPDHADSNYRLARETLLDGVPLPVAQIHGVPVEVGEGNDVAQSYEEDLRDFFGRDELWPRFDLLLLGLGSDGHTASLFPGSPALEESQRWVVATPPGTLPPPVHRVTLTLPAINAAREVLFLVAGADKAGVLHRVLQGDVGLPAARVRPAGGDLYWFVDLAAIARSGGL